MPLLPANPRARKALRYSFTAAVVGVVGWLFTRTLLDNRSDLADVSLRVDGWIVGAVVLFALAVTISGQLWGRMTSELSGEHVPAIEGVRVHCASWLLKYIPGQVGAVANKIAWAQGYGVPKLLVTLTFIYENLFLLIGSLVPPSLVLLAAGAFDLGGNQTLLLALASLIPLVALTNRHLFRWITNLLARRVLKREVPPEYFLRSGQALRYQLLYLIPRVVNGAGFVFIAVSMTAAPAATWLPLASAYIIAGAVGILAVLVPSGIGVREYVIVLLVAPHLSVEEAIVLSLAARLYATIADGIVALIYAALTAAKKRKATT
ncbi:MAG: hypothetical protein FWD83_03745 [Promicromonosporaceae bacterium]|nr:hypothetical protein [Promicromonosporaceae bacterium]